MLCEEKANTVRHLEHIMCIMKLGSGSIILCVCFLLGGEDYETILEGKLLEAENTEVHLLAGHQL